MKNIDILIRQRCGRHNSLAQTSHHNVIQQIDSHGNHTLERNGNGYCRRFFIKLLVCNQILTRSHTIHLTLTQENTYPFVVGVSVSLFISMSFSSCK